MTPAGFPHSGIHGSLPAFGYPWLFVDRYALLRLLVPRHPPCALSSLTIVFLNHARITFWVLYSLLIIVKNRRKPLLVCYCLTQLPLCRFTFTFVSLFNSQGTPAVSNSRSRFIERSITTRGFTLPQFRLQCVSTPQLSALQETGFARDALISKTRSARDLPPAQPVVGSNGLEPSTSRLSGVRSNHLSYAPISD